LLRAPVRQGIVECQWWHTTGRTPGYRVQWSASHVYCV
jgi:hypothetical protein